MAKHVDHNSPQYQEIQEVIQKYSQFRNQVDTLYAQSKTLNPVEFRREYRKLLEKNPRIASTPIPSWKEENPYATKLSFEEEFESKGVYHPLFDRRKQHERLVFGVFHHTVGYIRIDLLANYPYPFLWIHSDKNELERVSKDLRRDDNIEFRAVSAKNHFADSGIKGFNCDNWFFPDVYPYTTVNIRGTWTDYQSDDETVDESRKAVTRRSWTILESAFGIARKASGYD